MERPQLRFSIQTTTITVLFCIWLHSVDEQRYCLFILCFVYTISGNEENAYLTWQHFAFFFLLEWITLFGSEPGQPKQKFSESIINISIFVCAAVDLWFEHILEPKSTREKWSKMCSSYISTVADTRIGNVSILLWLRKCLYCICGRCFTHRARLESV